MENPVSQGLDNCVILCGAWAVWSERNARKHGETARSVSQSVKWACDIVCDLTKTGKEISAPQLKTKVRWRLPADGQVKINVDAAFSKVTREGRTGIGIRDHNGKLLRGQAIWYESAYNALAMEAYAVRDGIQLAIDVGIHEVTIETDSQHLVNLWTGTNFEHSEVAAIMMEIKELSTMVRLFTLNFIPREANELAHLCAKQCSSVRRRCLWINYIPTFLDACIKKDCKPD